MESYLRPQMITHGHTSSALFKARPKEVCFGAIASLYFKISPGYTQSGTFKGANGETI
jgi:hypothetical protein